LDVEPLLPTQERRCARCILPESFPDVNFDKDGVCGLCREWRQESLAPFGKEKLLEVLRRFPSEGEYDCLVPLSGGKDSTYVLYYAVKEMGLKAVAMCCDAGFQTPESKQNIRLACENLNVPLEIVSSVADMRKKLVRQSLIVAKSFHSVVGLCATCEAVLRASAIKIAREKRIPVVLWGASTLESKDYKAYRQGRSVSKYISGELKQLKDAGMTLGDFLMFLPRFAKYCLINIRERSIAGVPGLRRFMPFADVPFPKERPAFIHFYDYLTWEHTKTVNTLKSELGWTHPPGRDTRFDCRLHAIKNTISLQERGITGDGAKLCKFVREGKTSREDALAMEKAIQSPLDSDCRQLLSELNLDGYVLPTARRAAEKSV